MHLYSAQGGGFKKLWIIGGLATVLGLGVIAGVATPLAIKQRQTSTPTQESKVNGHYMICLLNNLS